MSMFDYMKTPDATYNPYAPAPKKARRKFKGLRLFFEVILIVIIIILITTGGNADSAAAPAATGAATAEATEEQDPAEPAFPGAEPGDVVGQSGEPLALEDYTVTASALTDGETSNGTNPTLCATVTLRNNADATADFDTFDWNLQTPSGVINYSIHYGSDNFLRPGKIASGGTASGDVCFTNQTPEAGQHILLYTPALSPDFEEPEGRGAWLNNR